MKKQIKDRLDIIIGRRSEYGNIWHCYQDCREEIPWGQDIGIKVTPKEYQEYINYITDKLGI